MAGRINPALAQEPQFIARKPSKYSSGKASAGGIRNHTRGQDSLFVSPAPFRRHTSTGQHEHAAFGGLPVRRPSVAHQAVVTPATGVPARDAMAATMIPRSEPSITVNAIHKTNCGTRPIIMYFPQNPISGKPGGGDRKSTR